jgi:DNA-binding CsgD family transcriptional regulator
VAGPSRGRAERQFAELTLLRELGREGPVLLVVDDLQDLDREDGRTLAFVARRLTGSRVGLLASVTSRDGLAEPAGLPLLHVPPLGTVDAARLVRDRFSRLPAHRVRQVVAGAAGNPLALCELAVAATRTGPAAEDSAGRSPTTPALGRFAARVQALPTRTQEALLVAALQADLGAGAFSVSKGALDALGVAERDGLVDVDGRSGAVRFRHPLVREVVCRLATPAERRAAHQAIARRLAGSPERQLWHLTAGADRADEALAGLAQREAWQLLGRGDATAAASLLARSAELGRQGAPRGRRLAGAAYLAALGTGELSPSAALVPPARPAQRDDGSLHAVMPKAYRLFHGDGEAAVAHQLLVGSLAGRQDNGRPEPTVVEGLSMLVDIAACAGRAELWASVRTSAGPRAGESMAISLRVAVLADPARVSQQEAAPLDDAIRKLVDEPDPFRITRVAAAGLALDRVVECREPLRRALAGGMGDKAVAAAMTAYNVLCSGDVATGRWDEADEFAVEGIELCQLHGHRLPAAQLRLAQALLAAARGDEDRCHSLVDEVVDWAAPRGLRALHDEGRRALALAALGRGDAESAYRHATAVTPAGRLAGCSTAALRVSMDLVEAAVRLGRRAEARRHAQAMRDAPVRSVSPRFAMLAAASTGLTAEPDTASAWFEEALSVPDSDRWPFDRARVELAYGEHLRSQRRLVPSRVLLGAALDTFVRLGARPWAARARSELRATGVTIGGPAVPGVTAELTPEERTIAGLAAAGLTNKQIARRLMMSHSTVAARLYQVFPKLGVGSRAALSNAMLALDDHGVRPQPSGMVLEGTA